MSIAAFVDAAEIMDVIVKTAMPEIKIFRLPNMSAILPNGTTKMAVASRYEVGIQASTIAFSSNSSWIAGSATFTDEAMNGVTKEVSVTAISTERFAFLSSMQQVSVLTISSMVTVSAKTLFVPPSNSESIMMAAVAARRGW